MPIHHPEFEAFLDSAFDEGNYTNDDVIAFLLPVFYEVLSFHETGLVAPFHRPNTLLIKEMTLDIDEHFAIKPQHNRGSVEKLFAYEKSSGFKVVGQYHLEADLESGVRSTTDLTMESTVADNTSAAVYELGYSCFEFHHEHHDEQSDIFCLGLLLASMAMGLNLYDKDDLSSFVANRRSPSSYFPSIHPTLSSLITEMTALNARDRARDLYDIIHRLENYRSFDPERQNDLSLFESQQKKKQTDRTELILNKLKNRLFDTSRRNRMLYYKANARFINLTLASVPMVLYYQSIRPNSLFLWKDELAKKLASGKPILLNSMLRFDNHPYATSVLDKIRSESRRDIQEFGFSQLKLAAVFLNWHDFKEDANERIQTPLLLLSVEISKIKKPREDHYSLRALSEEAEVNPVLLNLFRDRYGIRLPDKIDLNETAIEQFYQEVKAKIEGAAQGLQLNLIDKPRLRIIHSVARNTLNSFKKRLRKRSQYSTFSDISYSYNPEHYQPLGLELFRQLVKPEVSLLEFLIDEDIQRVGSQYLQDPQQTTERRLYELVETEHNPYIWEFDLCSVVLGNFNYKKMSLVQDYNQIIDEKIPHQVFERLFDPQPQNTDHESPATTNDGLWNHVIQADPTQSRAVVQSRSGSSFIIQGPPGTGKSQTITNLIADYVSRGKSVLFVCEKRAALDVVYFRLKQQKLDELCCYIHDSQTDKKSFVLDLKEAYASFLKDRIDLAAIEKMRQEVFDQLHHQMKMLEVFHHIQSDTNSFSGVELRYLLERLLVLKGHFPELSLLQEEQIPLYMDWMHAAPVVHGLYKEFDELGIEGTLAEHPFALLSNAFLQGDFPLRELDRMLRDVQDPLRTLMSKMAEIAWLRQQNPTMDQLFQLAQWSADLASLAEQGQMEILLPDTRPSREFLTQLRDLDELRANLERKQNENKGWKHKLSRQEAQDALQVALDKENSFFRFFSSSWKQTKKAVETNYAMGSHAISPRISSLLQALLSEYAVQDKCEEHVKALIHKTGLEDPFVIREWLAMLQSGKEVLLSEILQQNDPNVRIQELRMLAKSLDQVRAILSNGISNYGSFTLNKLGDALENMESNAASLQELLPALRKLIALPESLQHCLRSLELDEHALEAAIAHKTWKLLCREKREYARINFQEIEEAVEKIDTGFQKIMDLNGSLIRARVRSRFLEHLESSNMAISQLDLNQRKFKKDYTEGRKILENEFSKSMRYKSIRELCSSESRLVLRDIKPVWLMSPLSVSDSLPIDPDFFDVVIFDEASQITLEEGIPGLYRSGQTIIVGDEKQMPPSNFFTSKSQDPDDFDAKEDENEEWMSDDTDSLLVQGYRKLQSFMLGWHYRSKHETLISFSNHAFYKAGLLTIPDRSIHNNEKAELIHKQGSEEVHDEALFDRSISFHYMEDAIYEKRSNLQEAEYIADLIARVLKQKRKESLGIVAFSQEQQNCIEDALLRKANADPELDKLLEEAFNRHEDDQFVGLFIKNLENVQGDERDIIIMSVCYGFDPKKRMIMNFGPINKKGGEKRLNVLFSRAKKHMAVVSSIRHGEIKNEYNEGANYFKRFLHYAELVSKGHLEAANALLLSLAPHKNQDREEEKLAILEALQNELNALGFEVTPSYGQSEFRCSLAVKRKGEDKHYSLGILVDDARHYQDADVISQYYMKPGLLRASGWQYVFVSSKDWFENPDLVLKKILRTLEQTDPVQWKNQVLTQDFDQFKKEIPLPVSGESQGHGSLYDHLNFTRWEFEDDRSYKFWEYALDELKVVIRYGRINTKGQIVIKRFDSEGERDKAMLKQVIEKEGKGYIKEE